MTPETPIAPQTESVPFQFFVPVAKVDKEQRLVTGIVTQEILDKQGDIVDYDTAKRFFTDPDLWPGNMREMHQPKAVGKKVSVECDDDNKTISLTSRVSKGAPDTWEKILDGTLAFYSIGGNGERVAEKLESGGTAKRLFLKSLAETSYVDNGACPTAKFEIVKSVDGALVDAEPAEPTDGPIEKAVAAFDEAVAAAAPVEEPVAKSGPEPYDLNQAMGAISLLESLIANEYCEAAYGNADPVDVAQVEMLKAAIDAVLRFLVSEHERQFVADPATRVTMMADDVVAGMFLKSLALVQKSGARHSKNDLEMIQKVHDLSGSLGAACKDMGDDGTEKAVSVVIADDTVTLKGFDEAPHFKRIQVLDRQGRPIGEPIDFPEPAIAIPATELVTKQLAAKLETTEAALVESQATVAKQAETVAALDTRLKTLEAQPMPGGPARSAHAVEKTLGGPSDPASQTSESGDASSVMGAYDTLAAVAKNDAERMEWASRKLTYMRAAGLGALDTISGRPLHS